MDVLNKVLIVFGPTGVGKTDCVDQFVDAMPAEIVNGDMGQLYTPFTIGSAKPDWKNHTTPHHLFDEIDTPQNYSVTQYHERLLEVCRDIWGRGKLPIIVGGSTFYLSSLFFPPLEESVSSIKDADSNNDVSGPDSWEELYKIDPDRACMIEKDDTYRIGRALHIWRSTGKKPSLFKPVFKPLIDQSLIVYLARDRQELYQRINDRVVEMLNAGWVDEVKNLMGAEWESFIMQKKVIGYDTIIEHLRGSITYDEMVRRIQKRTRNYAKRQMTFWRMLAGKLEKEKTDCVKIKAVDLTKVSFDQYSSLLKKELETF